MEKGAQAERAAPPERVARAPRLVQDEESLSTRSNNATEMNVESDESVQLPPNVDVRAANVPHVAPPALFPGSGCDLFPNGDCKLVPSKGHDGLAAWLRFLSRHPLVSASLIPCPFDITPSSRHPGRHPCVATSSCHGIRMSRHP
ncbi:hypothetical protein ACFE04_020290 [Oxalis oulophora]